MTNTHAHPHLSPQQIESLLDTLGDLGHKKYANVVKPNPKRGEARGHYEYVREGHTVRDCTKRALEEGTLLADYAAKGKEPDPATYLIAKVKSSSRWDTKPHAYGVLYRLV
jgi:hypothetical protein